jgi:hypothetical protein
LRAEDGCRSGLQQDAEANLQPSTGLWRCLNHETVVVQLERLQGRQPDPVSGLVDDGCKTRADERPYVINLSAHGSVKRLLSGRVWTKFLLGDPRGPGAADYTWARAAAGAHSGGVGANGEKNRRGRILASLPPVNSPDPDRDLPDFSDPDETLSAALRAGPEETRRDHLLLERFERGPLTPEAIANAHGDLHDFGPGEAQEWAEEMVDSGVLEPAEIPDAYQLSDEGRRAIEDGPGPPPQAPPR